jgi:translation initiation factor 3 subunit F
VKSLTCSVHPTIVSNILDHHMRRPEKQEVVLGTLLGSVDGTKIDIQSSFAVPLSLDSDGEFIIDSEYA